MKKLFKALASEPRRRILNHLVGAPMTVSEISARFDMAMPSISRYLAVLRGAGLAHEQKRGQFVLYSVAADHLANLLHGFLMPCCPDAQQIAKDCRSKSDRADQGDLS